MKRPTSIQINIPQPCNEDWEKMTPQAKGRFCDSCQKCVVDFRDFSDVELYEYITNYKGTHLCGRFTNHQLNRRIKMPSQPNSNIYKWIVAAGMVIALAGVHERSFARAPIAVSETYIEAKGDDTTGNDLNTINGTIVDENNEPIVGAVIKVFVDDRIIAGAITDYDGKFKITIDANSSTDSLKLEAAFVGYKKHQENVVINKKISITLSEDQTVNLDEIIILQGVVPLERITVEETQHERESTEPEFDKWHGGNKKTIQSDELKNSPLR